MMKRFFILLIWLLSPVIIEAKTFYTVTISLSDLTLVVQDEEGILLHIWPVGAGGFGSRGELLTPLMEGWLVNRSIIKQRSEPYYRNLPFIRIFNKNNVYTPYGIHVTPFERLQRGYISHGCIHLAPDDLLSLVGLLRAQKRIFVRITMAPSVVSLTYPYSEKYYRYKNFGRAKRPIYKRDKYNLIIMEAVKNDCK